MAYLHCRIPILIPIRTVNQIFALQRVAFRFQSQLHGTGMGLESESESLNVNKPKVKIKHVCGYKIVVH